MNCLKKLADRRHASPVHGLLEEILHVKRSVGNEPGSLIPRESTDESP
jgi:hypothetical protein